MTTTTPSSKLRSAIETARSRAMETLAALEQAKAESEQRLRETGQADHLKRVTGKSSIENAITATQRMIGLLDRQAVEPARVATSAPVVTIDPRAAMSQSGRLARIS